MSLAMAIGRRAGALHKTLAEDAEDWLDRVVGTRRRIGHRGTRAMEQANHLAAAAAFGFGYAQLHKHIPAAPAVMLGAIYGASLYVTNIAGIAPLIRLTNGERNTSTPIRVERLGLHVLYGISQPSLRINSRFAANGIRCSVPGRRSSEGRRVRE